MNAHDFEFSAIDGGKLPLSSFNGRAVLVVNTASACGLTPQYTGLQELWNTYKDKGLTVLGVPCNDFGGQEPGTEAEVKEFCETKYSVNFPLTAKEKVIGDGAHPFYAWAAELLGEDATPKWNFHKFLVDANGELTEVFGSRTEPLSDEVTGAIEKTLG